VLADPTQRDDRRLILAAAATGALSIVSLPIAAYYHNRLSDWLRDASVYGLLAVAPALAINLRRSAGIRWVSWALFAAGAAATISFTGYWASVRGYVNLPFQRDGVLLPSFYLSAALLALASARAIQTVGRERAAWALVAVIVFVLVAGTGTRTTVILLAAPLVQLILVREGRALVIVIGATVVIVAALAVAQNRHVELGPFGDRLTSAANFVHHPSRDQSWQERRAQTADALATWRRSPLVGVGAGHLFHWNEPVAGTARASFAIDSPAGLLARFGVIGALVLLAFLVAVVGVTTGRLRSGQLVGVLPLAGLMAVALCGFVFGVPFEDKGFPVAFLLAYALTLPGAVDPPLAAARRRRCALALAAAVALGCVLGTASSGRDDLVSRPSIVGPITPPVRVIASFEEALWASDGVKACELLAPSARADYGSIARCRAVLAKISGPGPGFTGSRADAPIPVRDSSGEPGGKTLLIVVRRLDRSSVRYLVTRNRDGKWLILRFRPVPPPAERS